MQYILLLDSLVFDIDRKSAECIVLYYIIHTYIYSTLSIKPKTGYTDALIECTSKPDLIIKAKQRTYEMTESFAKLVYDAFDPANAHHWQNQIDWFHREVRFVDAESASIAEEVFDHLLLSKLAIDALHSMIKTNYRKDIGRRFVAKVGLIIKKFTLEIKDDEVMFRSKKSDPPIA